MCFLLVLSTEILGNPWGGYFFRVVASAETGQKERTYSKTDDIYLYSSVVLAATTSCSSSAKGKRREHYHTSSVGARTERVEPSSLSFSS